MWVKLVLLSLLFLPEFTCHGIHFHHWFIMYLAAGNQNFGHRT